MFFTIMAILAVAAVVVGGLYALPSIVEAFRSNIDEAKAEKQRRVVYREVMALRNIEMSDPRRMKLEIDIVVNKLEREILNEDS